MSVWKLRLIMFGCALATVGVGTLVLYALLTYFGIGGMFIIPFITSFVTFMAILQWLFAPYLIDAVYHVYEADPVRYAWLYEIVDELCEKSGIKKRPKVMVAHIPIPNAFAYGSPITGNRVAVTEMLLRTLNKDEIKAVLGHEIGHLKHRDVAWMLAISLIPMIIYYLGDLLTRIGFFGTILGGGSRENSVAPLLIIIGVGLLALGFVLNIFVLAFSRVREYFADRHSVSLIPNGGKLLQRALAKIVLMARYGVPESSEIAKFTQFKTLFIQDPLAEKSPEYWWRNIDEFIEYIKRRPITWVDRLKEIFSTHPNLKKRLIMLDKFNKEFWSIC